MLIWLWGASIIVLLASLIFVYRMLASSRDLFSVNGASSRKVQKAEQRILQDLKAKIALLEKSNAYYSSILQKFDEKLCRLAPPEKCSPLKQIENWEEMYYEENERRHDLENTLDATLQQLEKSEADKKTLIVERNSLASRIEAQQLEISQQLELIGILAERISTQALLLNEPQNAAHEEIGRRK